MNSSNYFPEKQKLIRAFEEALKEAKTLETITDLVVSLDDWLHQSKLQYVAITDGIRSDRTVEQGTLIPCAKCRSLPTNLIEEQEYNDRLARWETKVIYRKCPQCDHVWDREPPLKPWEVM